MGYQAAQAAIETLFSTNWPHTQIAYDGKTFDPRSLSEWVRIAVREADGNQASCGSQNILFRYTGTVFVQVFTVNGKGSGRALELADLVTPIFRSLIVDGIHYKVPVVTRVGSADAWYQVNVSCEYYREEIQA